MSKGLAKIARPLNDLLKNEEVEDVSDHSGHLHQNKGSRKSRESIQAEWTKQCEQAFDQLKKRITNTPVLAYTDLNRSYKLHVDASQDGLGEYYIRNMMNT